MADFSLLHLDDSRKDLEEFKAFLGLRGKGDFTLKSEVSVRAALAYLSEGANIHLCVVDYDLQEPIFPGSDERWTGLTFIRRAKLVSPNTNFILLSNTNNKELRTRAAAVGCIGIIKKMELRDKPKPVINQLKFACHYSEQFLKRRSDARLNFSQSVAHTLKSTLSGNNDLVRRTLECLEPEPQGAVPDPETARDHLRLLQERHGEIIGKIERVLELYTQNKIAPQTADLRAIIEQLQRKLESVCLIDAHFRTERTRGYFDPVLIQIALENLLDNAIKATTNLKERSPEILVHVDIVTDKSQLEFFEVRIQDNGVGLKPGTEDDINLPFFTADNLPKGTASFGIGCAEAEKIAMLHQNEAMTGSSIVRDRETGYGCEAVFRFPVNVGAA